MNTPHHLAIEKYNATLVEIKQITDQLRIFRIKPDFAMPKFKAGQFVTLGLGAWEGRAPGCQPEINVKTEKIGRRAYSVCSPVINDNGTIFDHNDSDWFELYITLVTEGKDEEHAPFLTPRLFNLEVGDKIWINEKVAGHYILEDIEENDDIIFLATGTGQAPHNTMLGTLLREGHKGRILLMECNRTFDMCGYSETLLNLAEKYENVFYKQLATREGNDRCRIQQFIQDGRIESEFDMKIKPDSTRVFLCGNPAMIGIPKFKDGAVTYASEGGVVEMLVNEYGLSVHHGHTPGEIYFEKYW